MMKRYEFIQDCPNCGLEEKEDGEYVLYEDAKNKIDFLKNLNNMLEKHISELNELINNR